MKPRGIVINEALAGALLVMIAAGALLIALAEAAQVYRADLLYVLGDNFFAFGALLACGLALTNARGAASADDQPPIAITRGWWAILLIAAAFVPLLTLIRWGELFSWHMLIALSIGAALFFSAGALLNPLLSSEPFSPKRPLLIYGALALLFALGALLRLTAPGFSLLTWIIAPLIVLIAPGLSLARVLLPNRTLAEQIISAPPLSVGAQVIVIMWLALFNVTFTPALLFVIAGAVTLAGAGALLIVKREHNP